jgi:hypothetical protein
MLRRLAVGLLAAVSVLTISSSALADYQMSSGSAGRGDGKDYAYEIWSNNQNTVYTLKVWLRNDYPAGSYTTHRFRSSKEASDYFECNYMQKSLPSCPQ